MEENMKNILIIMPNFYSYSEAIGSEFQRRGFKVTLFYEQPHPIKYLILRKLEGILHTKMVYELFLYSMYRKIKKQGVLFDFLLVIRGNILNERFLDKVAKHCLTDNANKVYYTWDSFKFLNHRGTLGDYFDKKFSFDLDDVETNNKWEFLPLFYTEQYDIDKKKNMYPYEYDLSCIAGFNEYRYEMLCDIQRNNPNLNMKVCLYISKELYDIKKKNSPTFKSINQEWLIFDYLSSEEVSDINLKSKAILDITDQNQAGLSMRTIESVGLKRKIVTNNANVMKYDIRENVFVITKENIIIPQIWIDKMFIMSDENRRNYSLSEWVNKIIS